MSIVNKKSHRHLIFSLQLKSLVPMLYSEAPSGELRSIVVTCDKYQILRKCVKKHILST